MEESINGHSSLNYKFMALKMWNFTKLLLVVFVGNTRNENMDLNHTFYLKFDQYSVPFEQKNINMLSRWWA